MKRNNLFMWAYISFIFAGILIRFFLDYPLWSSLVLAITLSSILFSLEDLFITLEKAVADSYDIAEAFSDSVYEDIGERLSLFDKIDDTLEQCQNTHNDIATVLNSFRPIMSNTEKLIQTLKNMLHELHVKKAKQKHYQKLANTFAYLGFLLLFCTVIFASFIVIPTIVQEIITVLSFWIILVTNQIKIILLEKIKSEIISSQNAQQAQKESRDFFSKLEQKVDYLTELLVSSSTEMEESDDAH